jgi:Sec-independent protein translocase protein TatA
MAAIGLKEILVIGVVVLLLFSTSILPKLARNIGPRLRDSKNVLIQSKDELEAGLREDEPAAAAPVRPAAATSAGPRR